MHFSKSIDENNPLKDEIVPIDQDFFTNYFLYGFALYQSGRSNFYSFG